MSENGKFYVFVGNEEGALPLDKKVEFSKKLIDLMYEFGATKLQIDADRHPKKVD